VAPHRLQIANRRLRIDGMPIVDRRSTDGRVWIADDGLPIDGSSIAGRPISTLNRQSAIHQSPVGNPQSVTPQSTIRNPIRL
jgi:hypothetical protein